MQTITIFDRGDKVKEGTVMGRRYVTSTPLHGPVFLYTIEDHEGQDILRYSYELATDRQGLS